MEFPTTGGSHFVLIPLMAQGHTIPMLDLARLLVSRSDVEVTFVTTPLNAALISPLISDLRAAALPITFLPLHFPCTDFGLPAGTENLDALPSRLLGKNFLDAAATLRSPLVLHLRSSPRPPTCVVTDAAMTWSRHVADEFTVPRLVFHGFGSFALLCIHNIRAHNIIGEGSYGNPDEVYVVPDIPLPDIQLTRAKTPGFAPPPNAAGYKEEMRRAEESADGIIINTFDELEDPYRSLYEGAMRKKCWTVGPLSLGSSGGKLRGKKASADGEACLRWLNSMPPGSVVYVSFGSMARMNAGQIMEIGLGLEDSGRPFVWALKEEVAAVEGVEERTKGRGVVVRGWAPQVEILFHPSVGGFLTHCGWNSTIEGVAAGLPMATWPRFAEQFVNERLVVDVLRVGVAVVGADRPVQWGAVEEGAVAVVGREEVCRAVTELMEEESEEGRERRRRAESLAESARRAMRPAGSSHHNLNALIDLMSTAKI